MAKRFNIVNETQNIEEIAAKRDELLEDAANALTSVMVKLNRDGETSKKVISDCIDSLLRPFNDTEKLAVVRLAVSKLIVNL